MPIILSGGSGSSGSGVTHTVQDVISAVSQDLRNQLAASGATATILVDYTNRVSLEILRMTRWPFLLSDPQSFITRQNVTDYWFGATGSNPVGSYDTGLNLTDVYRIKDDTVIDRSNYTPIYRTEVQPPNFSTFEFPSGQSRPLRPTNFYHKNYSGLITVYPAANNQNTFQPSPESPICVTVAGGALSNRTYSVKMTIVDSAGLESDASSNPTSIFVPSGQLLKVLPPKLPATGSARAITYDRWKLYASTTVGSETLQSGTLSASASFTEPGTGLVAGASAPTVNNITPMDGYVIEFRYWQQRLALTSSAQTLQIPDDYFDVVVAGVNMFGFQFLKETGQMKVWMELYQQGLREMVRDRNQFTQVDFLKPDGSTQQYPPGIVPGFITGN